MTLNEQEIMNAICLHIAERKQIQPSQVQVQLMWDEDLGFSAEVIAEGRSQYLIEANMKEAIERYMLNQHGRRVFRSQIELDVEDEMFAVIHEE
ncbi:hypothetical protein J31TS4_06390 [Paenibacillus sp. J31TS4]|uniref:YxcD family protein n=1 Tax=Paenibacillus sp. J31TS4 TaxID=2807195 RepID=UPI001B0EE987|nr:YxcD family protein [Paenibacillus sp. J31TS4]GIP37359.1 hypothetical protein J31TS4_06390 [Paenibacillus sp. J31TS4]